MHPCREANQRGELAGRREHVGRDGDKGEDPHRADHGEFQENDAGMFISYSRGRSVIAIKSSEITERVRFTIC